MGQYLEGKRLTHGDKGQKGPHRCSQPGRHNSVLQKGAPLGPPSRLMAQLGSTAQPPRPWISASAFRVGGHLPYGDVLVGVWLCDGAGSSGFGAGTGFGRLWVLPPPDAGGRRANRTPGEQEQRGQGKPRAGALLTWPPGGAWHPGWGIWDQHLWGLQPPTSPLIPPTAQLPSPVVA